jgi:hypothetical protein
MKTALTLNKMRFASCARGVRLLKILPEVASCDFVSLLMNKMNLYRREIFRGKISLRKNQINQTDLEERTQSAPNQ